MPVHEDEHPRESIRRAFEHGTRDHFARTGAQTRRGAHSAHVGTEPVECDRLFAKAFWAARAGDGRERRNRSWAQPSAKESVRGGGPGAPKQKRDPLKRFAVFILPSRRNFSHNSFSKT